MKRKLVRTKDGSHSLYVRELDEHFHSIYGAVQESEHIFIKAGLLQLPAHTRVNILEIGFGTGLNALLTLMAAQKRVNDINYTAVEAYPLTMKEAGALNYTEVLNVPQLRPSFIRMHDCNWGNPTPIHRKFVLTIIRVELQNYEPKNSCFDLVYFDAFAPKVQPELWSEEIFGMLYKSMRKKSLLVTYCAKGSVRRAMKAVGFNIESIPGPAGKREITRATKQF